jgi:hypothetical protein
VLLVTSDQALPAEPAPDVQAALTALSRPPRQRRPEPWGMVNLRNLHLARAVLGAANLADATQRGDPGRRTACEGEPDEDARLRRAARSWRGR